MTKRERERLRKSIERGAEGVVFDALCDIGAADWWCDDNRDWHGPEVTDECRAVYERVCKALNVKARKG